MAHPWGKSQGGRGLHPQQGPPSPHAVPLPWEAQASAQDRICSTPSASSLVQTQHFHFIRCHSVLRAVILNFTVFLVSPSRKYVWDQLGNRREKKLPEGFFFTPLICLYLFIYLFISRKHSKSTTCLPQSVSCLLGIRG